MRIKELPDTERPREKLIKYGVDKLSNRELIAILIRTGVKGRPATDIADEILAKDGRGIGLFADCFPEELAEFEGVGMAKATQLIAAVELGKRVSAQVYFDKDVHKSPADIAGRFMEKMRYCKNESFVVVLLNVKNQVIAAHRVAIGDISSVRIHPREVFTNAIRRSAAAVIFVHNHPSGDPTPSKHDLDITERLIEAGEILGIKVLDHIVIGDGRYISFLEENLM